MARSEAGGWELMPTASGGRSEERDQELGAFSAAAQILVIIPANTGGPGAGPASCLTVPVLVPFSDVAQTLDRRP
jgi:hypothetical protein